MNKILVFFNRIMGLMVFLIFVIILIEHIHHAHHCGMWHHRHFAGRPSSGDTTKIYKDSLEKK